MIRSKQLGVFICCCFAITLAIRCVLIGYYNNNLGGIEPNVIYGIQRLLMGQQLYQDPATVPYAVIQYPPLYYHLIAGAAGGLHVGVGDVQDIYKLCRVAALLFNLLTIGCCYLIIRMYAIRRRDAAMLALPVLMAVTSHYYTRGDSLALLFFVSALYCCLRYQARQGGASLLFSALFTAAAIATRQNGVLAAAIIVIGLAVVCRRYVAAAAYAFITAIATVALLWVLVHPHWQHYYQNTVLGLKNGIDPRFLVDMFSSRFFIDLIPAYVLGGIVVFVAARHRHHGGFGILAVGVAGSFLFAVSTGLKTGSSNNYFTEFLVLVLVAAPQLLRTSSMGDLRLFRQITVRQFAVFAIVVLTASRTAGLFTIVFVDRSLKNNYAEYASGQQLYNYFLNDLHIASGTTIFFTERRFLDNQFAPYALFPTRDVVQQIYAADTATYNYRQFVQGMNAGGVDYIVTTEEHDDVNSWHSALPFMLFQRDRFRLVGREYGYVIYGYVGGVGE